MPKRPRQDTLALFWGIAFCALFTALIWALGGRLEQIEFLPDEGYHWYYWKLPEKTLWGWWSAWGLYALHQLTHFGLIYYAQTRVGRYSKGLHKVNRWALATNGVFVMLHLLQTHLFYDGLAQDHPPQYPQYSVILLLVWVLLMENQRRGLFFGRPIPVGTQITSFARRYHGYVFSWAILYTFWYHPTHTTLGHLSGFFYTLLIMLQSSLFFTRIHTNRYWTFFQEFLVLIHGTIVAYLQGPELWPMFLFGFAGIFIVTQMHGIGISRTPRFLLAGLYLAGVVAVYHDRGSSRLNELLRIPLGEYLLVVILALLIGGSLMVYNVASGRVQIRRLPKKDLPSGPNAP